MGWHTDEECVQKTIVLGRDVVSEQRVASVQEASEWVAEHGEEELFPLVLQHLTWAMTRSDGEPPPVTTEAAVAVAYRLYC